MLTFITFFLKKLYFQNKQFSEKSGLTEDSCIHTSASVSIYAVH